MIDLTSDLTRSGSPRAENRQVLDRLFGSTALLPLWIAEPYLPISPAVVAALTERAADGWYGYEVRPKELSSAFWKWTSDRHGWDGSGAATLVSPSIGASIAVLIDLLTEEGDGVVLQPPVYTEFKPLIHEAGRRIVKNPLVLEEGRYSMDHEQLASVAADPRTKLLIVCNPHNPVGRLWTSEELSAMAAICAENDVFVISDEIHGDLALDNHSFTPFGPIATRAGARWAATHGPIKTFGLAGVADTLLVTGDDRIASDFKARAQRYRLNRNNVFSLTAARVAYEAGGPWLRDLIALTEANLRTLASGLPEAIGVVRSEATYLAWLDFRKLGLDVPELTSWLVDEAGLALSPGHWFGREGAGFARMTIAAPTDMIELATERLRTAADGLATT